MSKFWLVLIGGAIAAAIYTGVLDVQVHTDELGGAPEQVLGLVTEKSTFESVRARGVSIKRQGELWLVKETDRKLDIAFMFVESDVKRLNDLLAENADDPDTVLPQAQLLIRSINQIGDLLVDAPVDTVAAARERTKQTLGEARTALAQLQQFEGQSEDLEAQFAAVTSVLEWNIGQLDADAAADGVSAVAGDQDGSVDGDEPTATPTIPLDF